MSEYPKVLTCCNCNCKTTLLSESQALLSTVESIIGFFCPKCCSECPNCGCTVPNQAKCSEKFDREQLEMLVDESGACADCSGKA